MTIVIIMVIIRIIVIIKCGIMLEIAQEGADMARRAVIDREELFEAASTMAAQGKDVTALALLNALGGGSLTTIYKYLADWEAQRPKTAPTAGGVEIPDVVQNAFMSAWRVAAMEAARETVALKEKAAEEVKAARKQFEGALEAIQKLESESENDAAQIEALKTRVSELETAVIAAGNDNAALKATVEQLRQQVKSQQTDLEAERKRRESDLTAAHEAGNAKLESLRKEHQAAISEGAKWRGQAETLEQQNSELLARIGGDKPKGQKPTDKS